ncbi:hypothetical protein BDZ89DRAFT_1036270 [Hymenopellis radicata]|nr:hypothetical protein BDZ89DRAFT_1036270 [Hymenopellis radicata]
MSPSTKVYLQRWHRTSPSAISPLKQSPTGKAHAIKYIAGDVDNNQAVLAKEIKAYLFGHVAFSNRSPKGIPEPLPLASYDLLKISKESKFIPVTTDRASLTGHISMPAGNNSYTGVSKVALNYIARRIHFENDWLGETAAKMLVDIVDNATREKEGGESVNIDGSEVPW